MNLKINKYLSIMSFLRWKVAVYECVAMGEVLGGASGWRQWDANAMVGGDSENWLLIW